MSFANNHEETSQNLPPLAACGFMLARRLVVFGFGVLQTLN